MSDVYDLDRFVRAQNSDGTYQRAVGELRRGRKTSHWMWFVFPQIAGLGYSATSRRYAITSLDEARAYLGHPVLGPRLRECAAIVAGLGGDTGTRADSGGGTSGGLDGGTSGGIDGGIGGAAQEAGPGSATLPGANVQARTAEQIFGGVDAQKLHSSMTLFTRAAPDEAVFAAVLERYFGALADPATIRLI